MINVTICPSFYPVNLITKQQEDMDEPLFLNVLETKLREIISFHDIYKINIIGGEISLLSSDYFTQLMRTVTKFFYGRINVYSDLDNLPAYLIAPNPPFNLNVIMNEDEKVFKTMENLLHIPYDVDMMILIRKKHMNADETQVVTTIESINKIENVSGVLFNPYALNTPSPDSVTPIEFENFLKRFIQSDTFSKVLLNRNLIENALQEKRGSYASDHVYITPKGKYAVRSFTNPETLLTFETWDEYQDWCDKELKIVNYSTVCGRCPYVGHCLTDGYQFLKNLNNSCNGYKFLLDWYRKTYPAYHVPVI